MLNQTNLTPYHLALLQHINTLFARQNLCNSTYLFKQIKNHLLLPIYIIVEERKIAQITNNEDTVIEALQMSHFVKVSNDRRSVTIVEYPTLKFPISARAELVQFQSILKQKNKKYQISERAEKEFLNLTLFQQDSNFLSETISKLSKNLKIQKASLYEDMKAGVARIKKIKHDYNRNQFTSGRGNRYSFDKPPQIFIRKAVDTDEEEEADEREKEKNGQTSKNQTKSDKKKKYKQAVRPILNNDDFPTLI